MCDENAQTSEIRDFAELLRISFFLLAATRRSPNFLTSDTMKIDEVRHTRNIRSKDINKNKFMVL